MIRNGVLPSFGILRLPLRLIEVIIIAGMRIKRIEIDGFKSYAQRQVIDGFDAQFNAITGLNGSGKSNILDAICFVLGISNLSQVRAAQLSDLVYKQGQAGISKATVTITFDNTDISNRPVGFDKYDEIVVRRQVRFRKYSKNIILKFCL
ncbi:unnamed protein product [Onchocerca flexuosa]|uniref:SMC_N domain-containing protein n=1 Tax=Onchocerca flexuosa TaxID=387005 RepID=A0A183HY55_9BILA|nr:unnamed protein product [Onchocerca flexuosa]